MRTTFEPILRNAMIKAVDKISQKASEAELAADGRIGRLLQRWNAMPPAEKDRVAGIIVATTITAVGAIYTLRRRGAKAVMKKAGRSAAGKAVRKLL